MNKEQQGKAVFVSFCIEQYAKAKKMPAENVMDLFEQYGILSISVNSMMYSIRKVGSGW